MVMHAPPSPGEIGPGRRHRNLLRQLTQRHRVSVLSFGTLADYRCFLEEFGRVCERAVFCDMRRGRVRDVAARLTALLLGRSEWRRLYRLRFQRALDAITASHTFDLVIFSTTMFGCYRLPRDTPVIGDTHNVEHDSVRRAAAEARDLMRRLYYRAQASLTLREERKYNRRFTAVWATSQRDAALISAGVPAGPVRVVPNGLELGRYRVVRHAEPATLLFTGLMSYHPNWHGALHFIEQILPLIEMKEPSVRFVIVGPCPPRVLRKAAGVHVEITGYVPSIWPYFERASAFVVPLAIGGGTRVKVLEALASGVPVISTSIGCEGLDVVDGESILIADSPQAFADAVLRVLMNPSLADLLACGGRVVAGRYDLDIIGELLDGFCAEAVRSGCPGFKSNCPSNGVLA